MGYAKSRNGCRDCKLRKVKCDEQVPCGTCIRRGVKCTLVSSPVVRQKTSPRSVRTSLSRSPPTTCHQRTQTLAPAPLKRSQVRGPETILLWTQENYNPGGDAAVKSPSKPVESPPPTVVSYTNLPTPIVTYCGVSNYWSTIAYKTIPHGEIDTHLWQVEVPQLATEHPVLMELLMAICSHHQAYIAHCATGQSRQRDEHASQGFHHHRRAGALMTKTIAHATRDNGRVCFIASLLIVISAYANGLMKYHVDKDYRPSSMLDDLILIYSLSRGSKMVRDTYEVNMRPHGGERVLDIPIGEPVENGPLKDLLQLISSCQSLQREENERVRAICLEAMQLLEMLVRRGQASTFTPAHRAALQWICMVSDEYFQLLQGREPAALIVMSYCCAVIDQGAIDSFAFENWGRVVSAEIWRIVGL